MFDLFVVLSARALSSIAQNVEVSLISGAISFVTRNINESWGVIQICIFQFV